MSEQPQAPAPPGTANRLTRRAKPVLKAGPGGVPLATPRTGSEVSGSTINSLVAPGDRDASGRRYGSEQARPDPPSTNPSTDASNRSLSMIPSAAGLKAEHRTTSDASATGGQLPPPPTASPPNAPASTSKQPASTPSPSSSTHSKSDQPPRRRASSKGSKSSSTTKSLTESTNSVPEIEDKEIQYYSQEPPPPPDPNWKAPTHDLEFVDYQKFGFDKWYVYEESGETGGIQDFAFHESADDNSSIGTNGPPGRGRGYFARGGRGGRGAARGGGGRGRGRGLPPPTK